MKKIYFLLLTVLATSVAWSQTKTWDGGAGTTSWSDANNWNPNGVPASTNDVILDLGTSLSLTNVSGTIKSLTIDNNSTVTFSAGGGTQTLTIGNGTVGSLAVTTGSLTQNSSLENIVLAANATASINSPFTSFGAFHMSGTNSATTISSTFFVRGTFDLSGTNVVATVTGTGTLENRNNITNATAAKLKIQNGGQYIHARNGGTVPTATWEAGSTCEITGMTDTYPGGMNQTFVNLKFTSNIDNGNVTMSSSLNCTGNLTISNTGSDDLRLTNDGSDRTITVGGNFSMTSGNFVLVSNDGDGIMNVTGDFSLSGGTFRPKEDNGLTAVNITGNFSQSGGTFDLRDNNATSSATVNVTGGFSLSGTANFDLSGTNGATGTLNIAGNYAQSAGTITETATGNGAVNFNGTAVQTFSKTGGTISQNVNFTINNNAKVDFGTSVLNGSAGTFTLSAGGKIITANANGLGATGSIQVAGTKSFNSGADYEFQGASTGTFTTTPTNGQVRNFTVNNTTTNNVTLAQAMTVSGVLELTHGYLTTTPNLLTVSTTGSSTTANGAFVNGQLAKVMNSAGASFSFYVGTVSGGLRTIGATTVTTAGAGSTTFTARFFNANPKTAYPNATLAAGVEKVSTCEYWTLDRSTGGTKYNAQVTLSWSAASSCGSGAYITDPTKLRVLRHNGATPGTWTDAGYFSSTSSTVTSNTVINFSPFAIGTIDGEANPLPVIFGDVKAYEANNGVQIEWSNLTEKDVAKYTIEHSANGRDFSAIATQLPTSNQDDKASYTAFDAVPNAGANYYRIKAEETTGKIVYSKILSVNLSKADAALRLYPNPVSGNQVTISLSNIKHGQYNLRVVNTAGLDIFKQVINNQSSSLTQTLDLPSTIKPGVYNLIVVGDNYRATKTFIVQ